MVEKLFQVDNSADGEEKNQSYKTLNKEAVVCLFEQYRQDTTSARTNVGTDWEKGGHLGRIKISWI